MSTPEQLSCSTTSTSSHSSSRATPTTTTSSETRLFEATQNGELEIVKKCLEDRGLSFKDPDPKNGSSGDSISLLVPAAHHSKGGESLYFYRLLWAACIRDQASMMEFLLTLMKEQLDGGKSSLGHTVNKVDEKRGVAMIHFASNLGLINVVHVLIQSGNADVNLLDETGLTPLSYACSKGFQDLVELLLDAGANPNLVGADSFEQSTPLLLAAKQGQTVIVRALLEAGASMSLLDVDQRAPLHWAAAEGHDDTVKVLIKKGANVNATDSHQQTPLHLACQNGAHRVAATLLKAEANLTLTDANGDTALHLACAEGHKRIIALIIKNWPDPEEVAPQKLLTDLLGKTPLHYLCAQPMYKLVLDALQKWGIDILDINQQDIQGDTALIAACKAGSMPVIHALLINGADASLTNSDAHTALDFARRLSNVYSAGNCDQGSDLVNELQHAAEAAGEPSVDTDTDTIFLQ